MKRPYFNYLQRFNIYVETTLGNYLMLELRWKQLVRALSRKFKKKPYMPPKRFNASEISISHPLPEAMPEEWTKKITKEGCEYAKPNHKS